MGYTEIEMRKMSFLDIAVPEDIEHDQNYIQNMIDREIDSFCLEKKRYIRKTALLYGLALLLRQSLTKIRVLITI